MTRYKHTIEELAAVLAYDPETGALTWKRNRRRARAGAEAGCVGTTGYRQLNLDGVTYRAHRVAWAIHHGEWPKEVDHINRDRLDNRLGNLRDVGGTPLNAHNTSDMERKVRPFRGVTPNNDRWAAQIRVFTKQVHVGQYDTPELASTAWHLAYAERGRIYTNTPDMGQAEAIARIRAAAGSTVRTYRPRKQAA